MTARVEREFGVSGDREAVWEFLANPANRARAVRVVDSFDTTEETTIWHISLPIPGLNETISVKTRPVKRVPPEFVSFEGHSTIFDVTGEHQIDAGNTETRVQNRFVVDGHLPGVERFFRRHLDDEIANLETALTAYLER